MKALFLLPFPMHGQWLKINKVLVKKPGNNYLAHSNQRWIKINKPAIAITNQKTILKGRGYSSVVECIPIVHKVLSSFPAPQKQNNDKKNPKRTNIQQIYHNKFPLKQNEEFSWIYFSGVHCGSYKPQKHSNS
jgi:hypothetical protein